MNTVQLECFVTVAKHLNFSKASEELQITQPAVSHQIRSLEEELNVKLFSRTSKSVSLTTEGILFLPDADNILKTALSAKERLGRHEYIQFFDIGCRSQFELDLLPPILRALVEEFPSVHPSIHTVPFDSILGMVEESQLQAAFGFRETKKTLLRFRELFSCPVCCVCSADFPLADRQSLSRELLRGNLVLCSPQKSPSLIVDIQNQIAQKLSFGQRYFGDSIESALSLVKAGMGYTLLPALPGFKQSTLRCIPVPDFSPVALGIYYRGDETSPVLRQFLKLAAQIYASGQWSGSEIAGI